MIGRRCDADSASGGAAAGCIPGGIHVVPKWAAGIAVSRDHRLVVEMIAAAGEAEESCVREAPPAVGRFRDRHLSAVDAVAASEKDNDVAVEEISLRVEYQARVGAEIDAVGAFRRRERRVGPYPARAAVEAGVCAHGQSENLIRAAGKVLRLARVQRDVSLALRSALIRHVNIGAS